MHAIVVDSHAFDREFRATRNRMELLSDTQSRPEDERAAAHTVTEALKLLDQLRDNLVNSK